jgi:urate oxidase/2-oxo-4-hydroxy-4-carboxy-5-ureidoimidazoline decarboxylase
MAEPLTHSYGKADVPVYRIAGDRLFACRVTMLVGGEAFLPSYSEGDNSMVVATDSMKNFIHRVALAFAGEELEDFLAGVARSFLDRYEHAEWVRIEGRETPFATRRGRVRQRLYDDYGFAWLNVARDGIRQHRSGRRALHLIKLSGSSFAGFVRDEYTTLPEAHDRPLFVPVDVDWTHADFERRVRGEEVRDVLVETFADLESASIQHLLHEMGTRVLERFERVAEVLLSAENRVWDRAQENGAVAVYTDARPPFGLIHLELRR